MFGVRPRVAAAGAIAFALVGATLAQGTYAAGVPANKVAASGSTIDTLSAPHDTPILSETVKINNPTDLIIGVTAECAINTTVTNSANEEASEAFGEIKIYVTIDGVVVPIAQNDTDGGKVVFCNRAQGQEWTDSNDPVNGNDDEGDELTQYQRTRTANGFNWLALNVGTTYPGIDGSNVHKIEVWADWTTSTTGEAVADAFVGNRTLVLEPVKAAVGEVVTELG